MGHCLHSVKSVARRTNMVLIIGAISHLAGIPMFYLSEGCTLSNSYCFGIVLIPLDLAESVATVEISGLPVISSSSGGPEPKPS